MTETAIWGAIASMTTQFVPAGLQNAPHSWGGGSLQVNTIHTLHIISVCLCMHACRYYIIWGTILKLNKSNDWLAGKT